ncbi:MAG TPA: hypothetical protein VGL56_06450 [Fimbriimonadaceae bacterium]|jgi:cytochrome oxidase Cu insertion factor (SCO1/SenC/PrrC family)
MPAIHLAFLIAVSMAPRAAQTSVPDPGAAWVGTTAKTVSLKNGDGKDVDLNKEFGKHPVVIVFYRGIW